MINKANIELRCLEGDEAAYDMFIQNLRLL